MRRPHTIGVAAALFIAVLLIAGATGYTYAQFSDFQSVHGEAEAGVWAPDPPAACGDISDYKGGVVYGTLGDDVLNVSDNNQRQIVMGYAGDDRIVGGNSGDCLVGGDGNDTITGGNAKDILLGGPGNDTIDGGNAPDSIDGGGDAGDICDGGNGKNEIVNCPNGSWP